MSTMCADMAEREHGEVLRHQTAQAVLRDRFMRWQCRARQNAVRMQGGRPSAPMRTRVIVDNVALAEITILINKRERYSATPELQHMVRRTPDPSARLDSALQFLAAEYFQNPNVFSDQLTALFGPGVPLVERLVDVGSCTLEFAQPRQYYALPCEVENLSVPDPAYQATYWHNRLFNPAMPMGVQVLAFRPDWSLARVDPSPI